MRDSWWRLSLSKLALSLLVFGLLTALGANVFTSVQDVLFAVYWTFVLAAVLIYLLSSERSIRASVSNDVYAEFAANETTLVESHDLQNTQVYVPRDSVDGAADEPPVWLFVPRYDEFDLPPYDRLEPLLINSDVKRRRGLSLRPTGGRIFAEFESMLDIEMSDSPDELAEQLADGLTNGLELADRVTQSVRTEQRRIDFRVSDSVYKPVHPFDHPIQSFLAVGLATGFHSPIVAETVDIDAGRSDYTVRCYWQSSNSEDDTQQLQRPHPVSAWSGGWESKVNQEP